MSDFPARQKNNQQNLNQNLEEILLKKHLGDAKINLRGDGFFSS